MNKMTQNSSKFVSLFDEKAAFFNSHAMPALNEHRREAMDKFVALGGFPTRKIESYKYTDLNKVFDADYHLDFSSIDSGLPIEDKEILPVKEAYTINVVNGYMQIDEQVESLKETGVIICSLQDASVNHEQLFRKYYNIQAKESEHSIVALNTAFAQAGVFVYVPSKIRLDKPIQILNRLEPTTESLFITSRNLFVVEENVKVDFIDYAYTQKNTKILTNSVTELYAAANSQVGCYVLQNQSDDVTILHSSFISQKRDSKVLSNTISLNAKLIRNNITVGLEDENCENGTYGLYLNDGVKHTDNFSIINHIAPHCTSWEHFKGILDDSGYTAFCGQIHVFKDAQKTEAYQTNNNLLLSNDAKANTKPQLIIEADDVSCSHGATVGQLDDEAIFYLRARGINEKEAYRIMMIAFMSEITDKIEIEELQEYVENLVALKMKGRRTHYELK